MNLTENEKIDLKKNRDQIMELIEDCELIIGHPIVGIFCVKMEASIASAPMQLVDIRFSLEDLDISQS